MQAVRDLLFLPPGASSIADSIDLLHLIVISVTALGSAVVLALFAVFVWRYHGGPPAAERRPVGRLEAAFVAGLLALFVVLWAAGYRQYVAMRSPPPGALDVHVVGRQWLWTFSDEHGRRTQDVLVVPSGRPVRLLLSSRDVIHSFFVPAFRVKQDAVPGLTIEAWFVAERPGVHPILCAEYCGLRHSFMRGQVVVLSETEYARWLDGEIPERVARAGGRVLEDGSRLAARGAQVAVRYACTACHTRDGQPHVGPSWAGLFGAERVLADGRTRIADAGYLTESMMEPARDVVLGYEPVMPSYRGILRAADAAALVEHIRTLRHAEAPVVTLPGVRAEAPP